jgi:hypothetical protein
MNTRSVLGAAGAAVAFTVAMPATAHDTGETVTPTFEQAIPNIPGKSLRAVVVDYASGGASAHTSTQSRLSSVPNLRRLQ